MRGWWSRWQWWREKFRSFCWCVYVTWVCMQTNTHVQAEAGIKQTYHRHHHRLWHQQNKHFIGINPKTTLNCNVTASTYAVYGHIIIRNIGWELDENRIDRNEKKMGKVPSFYARWTALFAKLYPKSECSARIHANAPSKKCSVHGQLKILNDPKQVVISFHHFDTNESNAVVPIWLQ